MSVPRPEQKYRKDVLDAVSALLEGRPDVTPITMFGHPAFMVRGKMFACLYDAGLALKLPEAQVQEAMTQPNISSFQPYGKAMRAWVYIEHDDPAAYADDLGLVDAAIEYITSVAASPPRARAPRKRRALRP